MPLGLSVIPIIFLTVLLVLNVLLFGDGAIEGPNQIALLFAAAAAVGIGNVKAVSWNKIESGIVSNIKHAIPAIIILLLIGSLSGTWILSGIVPTMIYYGLDLLNPTIFLFASCIVCVVVSLSTGSSWSTIATVGIALAGIGKVMGISEGMIAGAIISGAYFGDKMSPLSDTTNLAPAMAGTDLVTHIRYMMYTTIPSITIALILYLILGFTNSGEVELVKIEELQNVLQNTFNISPWLLLVPVGTIILIARKVPTIPALFIGTIAGGVLAMFAQKDLLAQFSMSDGYWENSYMVVIQSMASELKIASGNKVVDKLVGIDGMFGMLNTVWLVVCAMIFGGVMDATGMLKSITNAFIKFINSTASLIATTTGTCVFFNLTVSDQYLAIVIPGKMFQEEYQNRNLAPENLSRTLEDSGTVTSALIPWNTCGAYHSSKLQIDTLTYLPYCFFNLLSPIMTILFAVIGIKIRTLNKSKSPETTPKAPNT
ncbi:MAG: Na+/H+ antiporter NhaC [Flavobacteriales bacterium]|nr:Na+/H+ antiporter NhaC [Flavobacteriales bacterium]